MLCLKFSFTLACVKVYIWKWHSFGKRIRVSHKLCHMYMQAFSSFSKVTNLLLLWPLSAIPYCEHQWAQGPFLPTTYFCNSPSSKCPRFEQKEKLSNMTPLFSFVCARHKHFTHTLTQKHVQTLEAGFIFKSLKPLRRHFF